MWFTKFQILISEPQSIWRKLLVLSWLYWSRKISKIFWWNGKQTDVLKIINLKKILFCENICWAPQCFQKHVNNRPYKSIKKKIISRQCCLALKWTKSYRYYVSYSLDSLNSFCSPNKFPHSCLKKVSISLSKDSTCKNTLVHFWNCF